jgi:hypothetical protein
MLHEKWSPEQICQDLRARFPDQPEMHVVHETVYQALYLQGHGELRRELAGALRSGRVRRKPRRQAQQRQPRYRSPMVMISDRPAEVEDRAVPGHWEGDLIIGKNSCSAIGTLVERSTRYVMLLHLPGDHGAQAVRDALMDTVTTLPSHLAQSLTWDQGGEMGRHDEFTLATDIPVYFCDPASPWQRGSNENTNGLLRQYFPKARTCPSTPPNTSARSPTNSTAAHAKRSAGKPLPSACINYSPPDQTDRVLQRSLESAHRPLPHPPGPYLRLTRHRPARPPVARGRSERDDVDLLELTAILRELQEDLDIPGGLLSALRVINHSKTRRAGNTPWR